MCVDGVDKITVAMQTKLIGASMTRTCETKIVLAVLRNLVGQLAITANRKHLIYCNIKKKNTGRKKKQKVGGVAIVIKLDNLVGVCWGAGAGLFCYSNCIQHSFRCKIFL